MLDEGAYASRAALARAEGVNRAAVTQALRAQEHGSLRHPVPCVRLLVGPQRNGNTGLPSCGAVRGRRSSDTSCRLG